MRRKPVAGNAGFFADYLAARIVVRGLVLGGVTYFLFDLALDRGFSLAYAQTIAFLTLIFGQLFHIFDARTFSTLYRRNALGNRYLLAAVAGSALLSLAVVYSPIGAIVFGTEAKGISKEAGEKADGFVHIPMHGFTESFNLSVSATICLTVLQQGINSWPPLSSEEKLELKAEWYRKIVREADKILEFKKS